MACVMALMVPSGTAASACLLGGWMGCFGVGHVSVVLMAQQNAQQQCLSRHTAPVGRTTEFSHSHWYTAQHFRNDVWKNQMLRRECVR